MKSSIVLAGHEIIVYSLMPFKSMVSIESPSNVLLSICHQDRGRAYIFDLFSAFLGHHYDCVVFYDFSKAAGSKWSR
jgi:hypothetical protein